MATETTTEFDQSLIDCFEGIACVRSGAGREGWNGINYHLGLNRQTVGTNVLSMNLAMVPPSGVAKAHIHVGFEVGLYIISGQVEHHYGEGLTERLVNGAGDFIFIDAGLPHEVYNLSDTEPVIAVVARTTPNQWDEIVPYEVDR